MSDSATTMKSKLVIGLKWLGAIGLTVLGGINVAGNYNVQEKLTQVVNGVNTTLQVQSGSIVKLGGRVHSFSDTIPLTMSGGQMNYDLASIDPADYFSGSGVLTTVAVMWKSAPAGGTYDVSWATAPKTASSSTIIRTFDNRAIQTGTIVLFNTGSGIRWNGGLRLKVSSLTNPTTSGSGWILIEGYEDISE